MPNLPERAMTQWIVQLREQRKLTWREIADALERSLANIESRPVRPLFKRRYTEKQVKTAYTAD